MNLREAAQMALDAYESRMQQIGGCSDGGCVVVKPKGMHTNGGCRCWKNERSMQRLAMAANSLTKALRAALAQPEQEPVACPYCHYSHTLGAVFFDQNCARCVKRMTAPPQREWQGLTDEEIDEAHETTMSFYGFARAIEAKLKEKNA